MGIRYLLRFPGGEDAGTDVTNLSDWQVGSEFIGDGNVSHRIRAIIPVPLMEEFIDRDAELYEAWEVEPV
jgi:hypothetical protein